MWFKRMPLEDWFDTYQYEIQYDVGESAVKYLTFQDLNIDIGALPLRYGYHLGRPDLREIIADQFDGVSPEHVVVTTGASEANFSVVASVAKPGDHAIIEHPNYPSLYEVPRSLGCNVTLFSLKFENNFKPDLEELKSHITPNTKLISMTHPNNPTGSMITEEDLQQVVEMVESHNIYLLFDETYRELAFGDMLPAAASFSPNVISISSMSKCYGLPGIRIGWLLSKEKSIIDSILAIREQVTITNGAISEEIAVSVLKRKNEFLRKVRKHVDNNFNIVRTWINKQSDVEWIPPEAGVVALPRIKKNAVENPEDVYRLLADSYKTFVIPGRCFELDNHYFRLGYGGTPEELKTGLTNIGKALTEVT